METILRNKEVPLTQRGFTVYYEEVNDYKNECYSIHRKINTAIMRLDEVGEDYDEMLLMIPKFGEEYDHLGANTYINVHELHETSNKVVEKLQEMNTSSVETSRYYAKASEKDDEATQANLEAAREELAGMIARYEREHSYTPQPTRPANNGNRNNTGARTNTGVRNSGNPSNVNRPTDRNGNRVNVMY